MGKWVSGSVSYQVHLRSTSNVSIGLHTSSILLRSVLLFVGIVTAICIGIFLSLVIAITLLPAICKHCPYKSPTSWALIYLGYQLSLLYTSIAGHYHHLRSKPSPSSNDQNRTQRYNKHFSTAHGGIKRNTNSWRSRELTAAPFRRLYNGNKNYGQCAVGPKQRA